MVTLCLVFTGPFFAYAMRMLGELITVEGYTASCGAILSYSKGSWNRHSRMSSHAYAHRFSAVRIRPCTHRIDVDSSSFLVF